MTTQRPRLLVTGAGGHLGRQVVERLLEAGADVISTTRDPSKLADLAARGVEVRAADFDDPASLAQAFAGADRLLLISTNSLDAPGRRIAQHRAAVAAAETAGVKHIVYTSAPSPKPQVGGGVIDDHFWTEQAIAATGLDWSFARHAIYSEIALLGAGAAVASGQLYSAAGSGGRSYVSREDCAAVDAALLLTATGREIIDVTGPVAVTQDELAALLSEVSGRPVTHVPLDAASLKAGLLAAGLPPFMADTLVTFDTQAAEGQHAIVTDAVERLTGRAPTSLRDVVIANRAALG